MSIYYCEHCNTKQPGRIESPDHQFVGCIDCYRELPETAKPVLSDSWWDEWRTLINGLRIKQKPAAVRSIPTVAGWSPELQTELLLVLGYIPNVEEPKR